VTGRAPLGDRWPEVDRLFAEILDRPPGDRQRALEDAVAGDAELLSAVRALLRADESAEGRLEAPGQAAARHAIEDLAARTEQPAAVGRYAIVREIGRGGMGTVYLGSLDGEGFRQQVAIKLLRRGVDTDDMLRRFLAERRILASLSHPNIARLVDGGATDDGRPFLAMEYVEGEPITAYCDRTRCGLRRRLELFNEACQAVSAAHASLVVHRDLKPSNILVTAAGQVKLLDFGIAKLLAPDEETDHTATGTRLLTPEHASPEQLLGEPVTTATDVYQLGVLLFQLLTGQRPHVRSRSALTGPAIGLDPPRPSTIVTGAGSEEVAAVRATTPAHLRRALKGDLDTITRKALQPEAARRYASAEQLAHDVQRFLDGRTISARPDTAGYRTLTFLRRHRWVAPVAAAAIAASVFYAVTAVRHARQLQEERIAATLQAERAQEVQLFLVDLFRSADPYAPADPDRGRRITVVEALDVGARRIETALNDRPVIRASILAAIADVYQHLGALDRARPLREEALRLESAVHGPASREVRDSLGQLGRIRNEQGDTADALALHEQRLALAEGAGVGAAERANARLTLALYLIGSARYADAEPLLDAVVAQADGDASVDAVDAAEAHRALSDVYRLNDRLEEAERSARRALALKQQALGERSVGAALAHVALGQALGALGRHGEADAHFDEAVPILENTLGAEHRLLLATLNNVAVLRQGAGNLAGAEVLQRRLVELGRRVHGERHDLVGDSLQNLATVLAQQDRLEEARVLYEQVSAIYEEALGADNFKRALPSLSLSGIHLKQGQHALAERRAREALAILERALPAGHFITAVAQCRVARGLVGAGRPADAAPFFDRASPVLVATGSVPAYRAECLDAAAAFYEGRGRADDAAALRKALAGGGG
jgi:serine/threonine-protein kinase